MSWKNILPLVFLYNFSPSSFFFFIPIIYQFSSCNSYIIQLGLFVVLACHYLELDEFDQHFQATVNFPLISAVDKPKQRK